jgi:hypothetical protein
VSSQASGLEQQMRVLGEMDSIADEHEEFVKSLARGGVTVSHLEIVQHN